ncbi:hypothetical protein ACOMHN_037996 [Nucella lapillus]
MCKQENVQTRESGNTRQCLKPTYLHSQSLRPQCRPDNPTDARQPDSQQTAKWRQTNAISVAGSLLNSDVKN